MKRSLKLQQMSFCCDSRLATASPKPSDLSAVELQPSLELSCLPCRETPGPKMRLLRVLASLLCSSLFILISLHQLLRSFVCGGWLLWWFLHALFRCVSTLSTVPLRAERAVESLQLAKCGQEVLREKAWCVHKVMSGIAGSRCHFLSATQLSAGHAAGVCLKSSLEV